MQEPKKGIPEFCIPPMPPPYQPSNYVLFDFYVGQEVKTIYGETGFIEACSMGRSGVPEYLVQTAVDKASWLHYDQIVEDRWLTLPPYQPYEPYDGPLKKG